MRESAGKAHPRGRSDRGDGIEEKQSRSAGLMLQLRDGAHEQHAAMRPGAQSLRSALALMQAAGPRLARQALVRRRREALVPSVASPRPSWVQTSEISDSRST